VAVMVGARALVAGRMDLSLVYWIAKQELTVATPTWPPPEYLPAV